VSGRRVGTGFDAHRLVAGRPLVLGGVRIPHDFGLEGHSDGDCVIHALCDALLGAAALGDMGRYFPSTDSRFAGASSLVFLGEVRRLLAEKGYRIENADVTVIAEAPLLGPHVEAMRSTLSQCLGIAFEALSVKAKTTDGIGATGRGEGIAAQAVALVTRRPGWRALWS
jgi:2-C-methyl-D-erythritol 2,4-cyclodiphosphate synthase